MIYVLQPFGIGDHIFSMKLVRDLAGSEPITWPVVSQFVEGLQRAYPDINWVDVEKEDKSFQAIMTDTVIGDKRIIPIRHANTILRVPYKDCMRAKYDLYERDWRQWRESVFMRDSERELRLWNLLGAPRYFRLINSRFRSDESGSADIPDGDLPVIRMERYAGYSLFDWALVIEFAAEIHTVGTGLSYLIELLDLTAPVVDVYKRLPDENHYHNYDYILERHKYRFH